MNLYLLAGFLALSQAAPAAPILTPDVFKSCVAEVNATLADGNILMSGETNFFEYTNSSDSSGKIEETVCDAIVECHREHNKGAAFMFSTLGLTVDRVRERVAAGIETDLNTHGIPEAVVNNNRTLNKRSDTGFYDSTSDCESVFDGSICSCDSSTSDITQSAWAQEFGNSNCGCPFMDIYIALGLPQTVLKGWLSNPSSWFFSSSESVANDFVIFRPCDIDGFEPYFSYGLPVYTSMCVERATTEVGGVIFTGM